MSAWRKPGYSAPPDLPNGDDGVVGEARLMAAAEKVARPRSVATRVAEASHLEPGRDYAWGNGTPMSVGSAGASVADLDVDRYNEEIDMGSVVERGVIEKKSTGHAGEWKERDFYLHTDRISVARTRAVRALDVIMLEEISAILVGPDSSSPLVRSQLSIDAPPIPSATKQKRRGRRVIQKSRSMVLNGGSKIGSTLGVQGVVSLAARSDEHDVMCFFDVCTTLDSRHAGRILNFRADCPEECDRWVSGIRQAMKDLAEGAATESGAWTRFRSIHSGLRALYEHEATQIGFLVLIVLAFLTNALESELQPIIQSQETSGKKQPAVQALEGADIVFTCCFSVELLLQIASLEAWVTRSRKKRWEWLYSGWLWLDSIVVGASWANILMSGQLGGGAITALRMAKTFRCFRILRIFKGFATLRLIVSALGASLMPVANTFIVLLVTTAVFSIIGLFSLTPSVSPSLYLPPLFLFHHTS